MWDQQIRSVVCSNVGHKFETFATHVWDSKAGCLVPTDQKIMCTACGGTLEELIRPLKKTRVAKPRTTAVPAQQEAQPENQEAQSSFVAPPPSGTEENLEQLDQS
jgi:hypothetical protein